MRHSHQRVSLFATQTFLLPDVKGRISPSRKKLRWGSVGCAFVVGDYGLRLHRMAQRSNWVLDLTTGQPRFRAGPLARSNVGGAFPPD